MESVSSKQLGSVETKQAPFKNRILKTTAENCGHILVVEDEIELREILEFNLIRQGFDVLLAEDGLEACRIIGREKPDLILLDLLLPLLNGWEICRMVRSHHDPSIARIPIIMMSALGSADDRLKGYELEADLYLPKPYNIKEVIIKSRRLIAQYHEHLSLSNKVATLQKWTELQDQWQQALFHELRNQLTVISGMAQHLRRDELPQERSEQFAMQISSSSNYLGDLAENYLLVRKMENNPEPLPSEPVILKDLLAELKTLFEPLMEQNSCELQISCPTKFILQLHPIGLKIILSSLLDNALKYSAPGGQVRLSVTETEAQIQIQIQDNGPGISEEEREKVFDKFFRSESRQQNSGGSGLGLYMARTLTESMGGSLQLVDNHLPGCCFQLNLPHNL